MQNCCQHHYEIDWIDIGADNTQRIYSCNKCHDMITVEQYRLINMEKKEKKEQKKKMVYKL